MDQLKLERIMDLVPVLMANGVEGDRLRAAALEAQRQSVIYASVWASGDYAYHHPQKPRARASIRKMFPGTVLREAWDPVEEELTRAYNAGSRTAFTQNHLGSSGLGPGWWYDSRGYPGEGATERWLAKRMGVNAGVNEHGKRYDVGGSWYLVDMDLYRAANNIPANWSNAAAFEHSSGFVEGLDVPGAPLPDWWDDECEQTYRQMREQGYANRNPHARTAADNLRYARGIV